MLPDLSLDWSQTEYAKYRPVPIPPEDYGLALPLVLQVWQE